MAIALVSFAAANAPLTSSAQVTTTYTYDDQGQVKTVVRSGGAVTYTYDQAGNRTAVGVITPPAAADGTLSVAYNSTASITAPTTGDVTSLVIDGNPTKGTVTTSSSTLTYTATWPNYGADSFTYHAVGPGGRSPTRTISVAIANGAAPTAANGSASTAYNAPVTITYPVSGDYAVAGLDSLPTHGSISSPTYVGGVGTQSTYTPQAGWIGGDSWTFHGTGPFGNSPTRTFTVNTAAPAAPTVTNTSLTATYNGSGAVVLPVGGVYSSIAFPSAPAHGVLWLGGTSVTYTANAGYYGADSFTYNATGPGGTSPAATVSVNVPRPPPPTAPNISVDTLWGTPAVVTPSVSGYYSSIAIANQGDRGVASVSGTTITRAGYPGYVGADAFTYTATGPGGTSAPATITVNVVAPPPPIAGDTSASIPYNTAANIALPITGSIYSNSLVTNAAHGTATLHGSYATYLPNTGYSGPDSFQYIVSNGTSYSNVGTVWVTVADPPPAPPPNPQPDIAEVYSRNTVVISPLVNDSDPSGYPLTITAVSSNGGGSSGIISGGTQISYNAPAVATRFNKIVTLTYTVSNGHGGSASSTITVTVETEYWGVQP